MPKKTNIKEILKKYNIRPSKTLGQNFLVDEETLKKIIQSANIKRGETIIEIGPGLGSLTKYLVKSARRVIAIEKDKRLAKLLEKIFASTTNIKIICQDILRINNQYLNSLGHYRVIANLPYNIALPTIIQFLESKNPPKSMILMVQKEVGQKICSEKESIPSLIIKYYAQPSILFEVPKKHFFPKPKVDGIMIKIDNIKKREKQENLFNLIKIGFRHPRKTILNNLISGFKLKKELAQSILLKAKINPQKRPENIRFQDWLNLSRILNNVNME